MMAEGYGVSFWGDKMPCELYLNKDVTKEISNLGTTEDKVGRNTTCAELNSGRKEQREGATFCGSQRNKDPEERISSDVGCISFYRVVTWKLKEGSQQKMRGKRNVERDGPKA